MTPNVNTNNQFSVARGDTEDFNKNRAALFSMAGLNMNKGQSKRDGPQIAQNLNKNLA